jgi:HD-like signal output (HDOD) protein
MHGLWFNHRSSLNPRLRGVCLSMSLLLPTADAGSESDTDADVTADAAGLARGELALARLLERLSRQPDFPSLGDVLGGVRRAARSEKTRLQSLSQALLMDVGLANRVLRMANAAHYRPAGGGHITTVSRAISVMGFDQIGRLALSSRLIDQIRQRPHSQALREEFLRALLAGAIGFELGGAHVWAEDLHVAAVFRNLGRLLCCLHLSEDAMAVREALPPDAWPRNLAELRASERQLGVRYDTLGLRVAQRWGWPDSLCQALRHVEPQRQPGAGPAQAGPGQYALPQHAEPALIGRLAGIANDLADLMLYQPQGDWAARCSEPRLAGSGQDGRSLRRLLERMQPEMDRLAGLLEMSLSSGVSAPCEAVGALSSSRRAVPATDGERLCLSMAQALGARRVVLCLRDQHSGDLVGRSGWALGLACEPARFVVPPPGSQDFFSTLVSWRADSVIRDTAEAGISNRLPAWWHRHAGGRSFAVLPIHRGRETVGMLYAEAEQSEGIRLADCGLRPWRCGAGCRRPPTV